MEFIKTFLPLIALGGGVTLGWLLYESSGCTTSIPDPNNDPDCTGDSCKAPINNPNGPDCTGDSCKTPIHTDPPPFIPINQDYKVCGDLFNTAKTAINAYIAGDRTNTIDQLQILINDYLANPCPATVDYAANYQWIQKAMVQVGQIPSMLPINTPTNVDPHLAQLLAQIANWGQCGQNITNQRFFHSNYNQILEGWQTMWKARDITDDVYAAGMKALGNVMLGC